MGDIDDIRRANLKVLEKESGGTTAAAMAVGMSVAQFSNLRDGAKDSKTGKPRGMRKETARKIEAAHGKPVGWLDVDHNHAAHPTNDQVAALDALWSSRLQASHRSQKVIDQLMALAQTGSLKEEDWKLIEQVVSRLRNR